MFPHLTVLENVRIALQRELGTSFHFWQAERVAATRSNDARAWSCWTTVGPGRASPTRVTVELPYGRKRALEIATTLALEPELMLLDEPTAGHGPRGRRPRHAR